ncbi:hypothetical protein D3C87_1912860 [compost metagenome]
MIPGQGVMQGGAVPQVLRVFRQAMASRIVGTAHGGELFAHQSMARQPGKFAVGVVQGQVDFAGAEIDIVIAYPQVQ